jgi:hypothetical protein
MPPLEYVELVVGEPMPRVLSAQRDARDAHREAVWAHVTPSQPAVNPRTPFSAPGASAYPRTPFSGPGGGGRAGGGRGMVGAARQFTPTYPRTTSPPYRPAPPSHRPLAAPLPTSSAYRARQGREAEVAAEFNTIWEAGLRTRSRWRTSCASERPLHATPAPASARIWPNSTPYA